MVTKILAVLSGFVLSTIAALGYTGIVLLMAIESAAIPLPSEIIMPFSGYLVSTGRFQLLWVSLAGGLGCLIGSVATYYLGLWGGRPLLMRYGRYVLISRHDLDRADRWFARYGDATVFFARLLPVIRTYISVPAGVARVPIFKFCVYTFVGSVIWSWLLAFVGMKLGERWDSLRGLFHKMDLVIGILVLAGVVWFVWHHWKDRVRGEPEPVSVEAEGPPKKN
jgi:membrane protein DedA with SNARE-associated domain